MSEISTPQTNVNDMPKIWNSVSLVSELEKMENLAQNLYSGLVIDSNFKPSFKRSLLVGSINLILWLFVLRVLWCEIALSDNIEMLLPFGDLASFYGSAINRLYYNSYLISWGIHAALMYTMITRNKELPRDWLLKFESCWQKASFRSTNDDILHEIVKRRILCVKILKFGVMFNVLLIVMVNAYGGYKHFHMLDNSLLIYIIWSVIQVIWCAISSIVNLSTLFHHHLICKAIVIRFKETNKDLEHTIRGSQPADPWILSRLLTKHYIVCDMIIEGNRYLKNYLFIFYIVFGPHICFLIYQLVFSTNPSSVKLVVAVLVLADALQIILISLSSSKITTMAHKPYHVVHGVGKISLPEDIQLQVTLFLQRLSGTAIGLTILDTFVITGGVISSICTAIVTYFSIIVEMN